MLNIDWALKFQQLFRFLCFYIILKFISKFNCACVELCA